MIALSMLFSIPEHFMEPIRKLTEGIDRIAEGRYHERVELNRTDEFGHMAVRFNAMAAELERWGNSNLALIMDEKARAEAVINSLQDASIGLDQVPGIQANRMKTQVDARFGVPLLLSGLLQQGMREQARGLPLLRQIPILGRLFGSEDYLNEQSELVAILLPASGPPSSPMARITQHVPRGPSPMPRQWISPSEERSLKQSEEWPWNALK